MEFAMFILNFELFWRLFAGSTGQDNQRNRDGWRSQLSQQELRNLQRQRDELRLAREKTKLQAAIFKHYI
jgi:hypothetical protein